MQIESTFAPHPATYPTRLIGDTCIALNAPIVSFIASLTSLWTRPSCRSSHRLSRRLHAERRDERHDGYFNGYFWRNMSRISMPVSYETAYSLPKYYTRNSYWNIYSVSQEKNYEYIQIFQQKQQWNRYYISLEILFTKTYSVSKEIVYLFFKYFYWISLTISSETAVKPVPYWLFLVKQRWPPAVPGNT